MRILISYNSIIHRIRQCLIITGFLLLGLCGLAGNAMADHKNGILMDTECSSMLGAHYQKVFNTPRDEINYTNRYIQCWSENVFFSAQSPRRSFLGKGLEIFANPANVAALAFSNQLCRIAKNMRDGRRYDYPCWFESTTAQENVSVEEATRREAPKALLTRVTGEGKDQSVQYVLCLNDDPSVPKEYSSSCRRGLKMIITGYGRGDINKDNVEDVIVNIKFGNNMEEHYKCFAAVFTRKEGELAKIIAFSNVGLCQ